MRNPLLLLTLGLVLLLGLAALAGAFDDTPSTIDTPDLALDADAITQIEYDEASWQATLTRTDAGWRLTAPVESATDSLAVQRFVEAIAGLDVETVVSTNPERYARYGVDSAATVVTVYAGDEPTRLYLGNVGSDFQSMFVRLEDDPRVFSAAGQVTKPTNVDAWRDKTVLRLPARLVQGVAVTTPDAAFSVSNASGTWTLTTDAGTTDADSLAVERWVGRFANLAGNGFRPDASVDDVRENATHRLVFTLRDGQTRTLTLRKLDATFEAVTDEAAEVYAVPTFQETSLFPAAESLQAADA